MCDINLKFVYKYFLKTVWHRNERVVLSLTANNENYFTGLFIDYIVFLQLLNIHNITDL